jgi:signal transduction histidine kinase
MKLHLSDQLSAAFNSTQLMIRYAEWTVLGGTLVYTLLLSIPEANSDYTLNAHHTATRIFIFLAWTILSLVFPIEHPMWQRRAYIGLEVFFILLAHSISWSVEILAYLLIIKSCFLLSRRDVVIVSLFCWFSLLLYMTRMIQDSIEYAKKQNITGANFDLVSINVWASGIVSVSMTVIFVVLIGFLVVKEHRSQQQIKILSQEISNLDKQLERTRIARDIHDTLGHTLTALNMQIEVAQQICLSQPEQISKRLSTAKQLADQCLQDIQNVVQTLRHTNFDLSQGLKDLMELLRQNESIRTELQLNIPKLSLHNSYQIYCVIQEAATNIQKHAKASFVSLYSENSPESLVIYLTDNGQGFNASKTNSGFGLQGMQERLQLIGGTLKIITSPGNGTQLRIIIPH